MLPREELEQLHARITVILVAVVVAFGILGFGFWKHQIADSLYYREKAENNRVREVRLPAPRGRILDREGRVIADSRPSYRLIMSRDGRERPLEETFAILGEGIGETAQDLFETFRRRQDDTRTPAYMPVVLREDLSPEERAFVEARSYELPDVRVEFLPRRHYEGGTLAAHVVGYVGEITDRQLSDADAFPGRRLGDIVGRTGLELRYDAFLQGQEGFRRVVVDKDNREIDLLGELPYEAGPDLRTTLDLDLQRAAEQALGGRTGVAVAMDPRTGEVLAMASLPSFDPTLFADGIAASDLEALITDPGKPFQNRAIQNRYSPGSVFKVFMTAAGLGEHVLDPHDTAFCPGHTILYGSRFGCWKEGGHGTIGLHDALVHSCNVFFYLVGDRLGIRKISEYAIAMGLGRRTGIDLPGEDTGLIPTEEWKRATTGEPWYRGETISVSIGQGAVSVTPLQVTRAMGALGVGGRLVEPHLVDPAAVGARSSDLITEQYAMDPGTLALIRRALWDVVNGPGTGRSAEVRGFDVAGKTGTAQVVASTAYGARQEYEDHAWFVGFAPFDDPEIAVGVFVENGGHGGSAAGPVAQAVFQAYFDKQPDRFTGNEPGDPMPSSD
jgi:penicillin-binding protein 2